jgi:hypothetical protein
MARERLVLRRHDRVDEDEREDQHRPQLREGLGLLFDFGAEPDREILGQEAVNLRQLSLHGLDRFAERRLGLGADIGDALLVLPLNLRRTDGVLDAWRGPGDYRIRVEAFANLEPLEDLYFVRSFQPRTTPPPNRPGPATPGKSSEKTPSRPPSATPAC